MLAVLDELADDRDAGGAQQLRQLGEVVALRSQRRDETARCLARRWAGARQSGRVECCMTSRLPRPRRRPRSLRLSRPRLAARTLELIDVPSESRDEAALAAHVARGPHAGGVAVRDAGDTCVLAGATGAANGRWSCSPATSTPSRRRATCPAGSRQARPRPRRADMKGALAVMIELALGRPRAPRRRPRLRLLRPRGAAVRREGARRRCSSASRRCAAPTSRS